MAVQPSLYLEAWQAEAELKRYPQAVADVIQSGGSEGERFDMSADQWLAFANRTSFHAARAKAKSMGISIIWDCEISKSPEGYHQVQGGIEYAIPRRAAIGARRSCARFGATLGSGPLLDRSQGTLTPNYGLAAAG